MKQSLLPARVTYIALWLCTGVYVCLAEADMVPVGFLPSDALAVYIFNLVSVILTMGYSWLALRLFTLKSVRNRMVSHPEAEGGMHLFRVCLMIPVVCYDLIAYYGQLSGSTPLFCLLIALVSFVFCWPKAGEFPTGV